MTVKRRCSERVWNDTRRIWQPCSRPATVERSARWFCWQHDPNRKAEEAAERRAARQARKDLVTHNWKRNARNAKLAQLANEETAALLERLANDAEYVSISDKPYRYMTVQDTEAARALAAQIREALDEH